MRSYFAAVAGIVPVADAHVGSDENPAHSFSTESTVLPSASFKNTWPPGPPAPGKRPKTFITTGTPLVWLSRSLPVMSSVYPGLEVDTADTLVSKTFSAVELVVSIGDAPALGDHASTVFPALDHKLFTMVTRCSRVESTTSKEWEVGGTDDGDLIRTVVDNPTYNTTYGYVEERTVTTTDPSSYTWTSYTDYNPTADTDDWCLGLPGQIVTTNTKPDSTYATRTLTRSIHVARLASARQPRSDWNTWMKASCSRSSMSRFVPSTR